MLAYKVLVYKRYSGSTAIYDGRGSDRLSIERNRDRYNKMTTI